MKSKIIVFIIPILIVLGLATYGYIRSMPGVEDLAKDQPQVEVTPQSFDFGEIEYGEIAEYTFKVKNSGGELLEIKKVATSCACTSAEISQETIKSQQEAELKVTYDTGAMSGSHAKGKQERIVYVKSNDPINPQVEVMIYANVQ